MNENELNDLSEFFKCFSDVTRIRILQLLLISPLNVGDIAK